MKRGRDRSRSRSRSRSRDRDRDRSRKESKRSRRSRSRTRSRSRERKERRRDKETEARQGSTAPTSSHPDAPSDPSTAAGPVDPEKQRRLAALRLKFGGAGGAAPGVGAAGTASGSTGGTAAQRQQQQREIDASVAKLEAVAAARAREAAAREAAAEGSDAMEGEGEAPHPSHPRPGAHAGRRYATEDDYFDDGDEEEHEEEGAAAAAPSPPLRPVPSSGPPPFRPLGSLPAQAAPPGPSAPNSAPPKPSPAFLPPSRPPLPRAAMPDEDLDPLEAFMRQNEQHLAAPPAPLEPAAPRRAAGDASELEGTDTNMEGPSGRPASTARGRRRGRARVDTSDEEDVPSEDEEGWKKEEEESDEQWAKNVQAGRLSKGDLLGTVDHSTIHYAPFRKSFYIEAPEISRLSEEELAELRKRLDGIKVRGKGVPRPIKTWNQAGLNSRVVAALQKKGFAAPMPIQAQALPIIMSGRDCIGIAKTGSGKTLAYVLPMLRHVKDQPPCDQGDGPVALIVAPTRELVSQIGKDALWLGRCVGLRATCVYGGGGVAKQISECKTGTEIIVCTPGRMIDLLVTNNGRVTNLRRVTYVVLDEADRMFDLGFEPQISKLVGNTRPDRQTVLFSATFPKQVESLARAALTDPIEILVGGRSTVNTDIEQIIEIRPDAQERFFRLLEILGEWYEKGKVLVFVKSQENADNLFRDLLRAGYPCLSLHGGKEQIDREATISDFKQGVCNVLVATSIAARGLDVRDLALVLNWDVPDHYEDYVHRAGRTGRAGNRGTCITFLKGEAEEAYAPDMVRALKDAGQVVPEDLQAMADSFEERRKAGKAQGHASGFGGSGFRFSAEEGKAKHEERRRVLKDLGLAEDGAEDDRGAESDKEGDGEEIRAVVVQVQQQVIPGPPQDKPEEVAKERFESEFAKVAAEAAKQLAAIRTGARPGEGAAAAPEASAGGAAAAGPAPSAAPINPIAAIAAAVAAGQAVAPAPSGLQQPAAAVSAAAPSTAPAAPSAAAAGAPPAAPTGRVSRFAPKAAPAPAAPAAAAGPPSVPTPASGISVAAAAQLAIQLTTGSGGAAGVAPAAPVPLAAAPPGAGSVANMAASVAASIASAMAASYVPPAAAPAQPGLLGAAPLPGGPGAIPAGFVGAVGAAAGAAGAVAPGTVTAFQTEIDINDFAQMARWKVTHREVLRDITETTGCAVIVRGRYFKAGEPVPEGERRLFLLIEGPSEAQVRRAKAEIKRIIEEYTEKSLRRDAAGGTAGRYNIV